MKTLFGRKVAIDASMSIYQFLIAVRQRDGEMLTNDAGETNRCAMNPSHFDRIRVEAQACRAVTSWVSSIEQ